MIKNKKTPLTKLSHPLLEGYNVYVKENYLNHDFIQGNKLYKLIHNLEEAKSYDSVITFGGAYSNHIAATAFSCKELGITCFGVIRGQELANNRSKWSKTLLDAEANGMTLVFLTRKEYRDKYDLNYSHLSDNPYIIPEGGTNDLAIKGVGILADEINNDIDFDFLYSAVGTGGTLSGLIKYTDLSNKEIIGVSTLKDSDYLIQDIIKYSGKECSWKLNTNAHFGGYGKMPNELLEFKEWFETSFNIPLDPIYTVKTMYSFFDDLKNNKLPVGSNIVLLHTGGLQGN